MAAPDVWDQGGTYTRDQLEAFRGPLNGNGSGPKPTLDQPSRSCAGCGKALTGQQQRWCSARCKRNNENANARSRARPEAMERLEPLSVSSEPAVAGLEMRSTSVPDPGTWVAVARSLPGDWRMLMTRSAIEIRWEDE